jgi:hypothetical protein
MYEYKINKISTKLAKEYIHKNHYSHGSHNGPSPCYGLFDREQLIGVCMFATPCSENVRASIFGSEYKSKVTELHRLHILDVTPKNTESWFISRCLDKLKEDKPEIECVVSFSDATEGHSGVIYRATNAFYYGTSSQATFYVDEDGRLRHPRQCGVNITKSEAAKMGWKPTKREGKFRYLWLLGGKIRRKTLMNMLKVSLLPYP